MFVEWFFENNHRNQYTWYDDGDTFSSGTYHNQLLNMENGKKDNDEVNKHIYSHPQGSLFRGKEEDNKMRKTNKHREESGWEMDFQYQSPKNALLFSLARALAPKQSRPIYELSLVFRSGGHTIPFGLSILASLYEFTSIYKGLVHFELPLRLHCAVTSIFAFAFMVQLSLRANRFCIIRNRWATCSYVRSYISLVVLFDAISIQTLFC